MKLQSLEELLADELKDLYSAASQMLGAPPELAENRVNARVAMQTGITSHEERPY
ncbi:MAG TPA: hypothetical protein VGJ22_05200 [Anaerolineales bacterium]|jgi:ferritin-like metal-binding protein YciE